MARIQSPYLARIDRATEKLFTTVSGLDDVSMAEPSLLPGWDRAMVVTHVAARAEALRRVVEAAGAGAVGELYPGGMAARDAEVEAGRGQAAADLEARLKRSCEVAMAALRSAPQNVWDAPAVHPSGETTVGPGLVVSQLREVEVHHVDLRCAYLPQDWPFDWVVEEMDRAMLSLPGRLPPEMAVVLVATDAGQQWVAGSGEGVEVTGTLAQLFAWVTGRSAIVGGRECPQLAPWR